MFLCVLFTAVTGQVWCDGGGGGAGHYISTVSPRYFDLLFSKIGIEFKEMVERGQIVFRDMIRSP